MMKFRNITFMILAALAFLTACSDDDSFTLSPSRLLTFSVDTVKLDTVFSNVPTITRDFWVYNRSGEGIRCTNIRLERGNQSGFRINVDGTYLGASVGFQTSDVELRNKDSIRVFVEATTPFNHGDRPQLVEDNLLFTLESGVTQKVNLNAYSWDARLLSNIRISRDSVLSAVDKPVVIYGGITVDSAATLTLAAGSTFYFHADAGIDVYGRLVAEGTPEANITLRGDRLDRMFDNLTYDQMSGQWKGLHFYTSSYDNRLAFTDIHGTFDGIVADSSDVERMKLEMVCSTIHSCQGYGLHAINSRIKLENCQITNTQNDCLCLDGGWADVNACTIAQFYPFQAINFIGNALHFTADRYNLLMLSCQNSLITGWGSIQLRGEQGDSATICNYAFANCIIRDTTKIENVDTVKLFRNVVFENDSDMTTAYKKHFIVTESSYSYDFRLDSLSTAIDKGDPATAPPIDRNGLPRDERPDIGAYEYKKPS